MKAKGTTLRYYLACLTCIAAAFGVVFSRNLAIASKAVPEISETRPPFHLPELRYVQLVSFGFPTVLSKTLWFTTLNYFGKQMNRRKNLKWLGDMCDLTMNLDSGPLEPLEFCSTMLAWVAKDPTRSQRILTLGIKRHPDSWRLYYLRGFNRWYFFEDMEGALSDFNEAKTKPDCLPFVHTLATRMLAGKGQLAMARTYLADMVEKTQDESARAVFQERLNEAILAEYLNLLNDAVKRFEEKLGKKPTGLHELVSERILHGLPKEPFGGSFQIDPETGAVSTTSGRKPLAFAGKTARTGIMAEEFKDWNPSNSNVTP